MYVGLLVPIIYSSVIDQALLLYIIRYHGYARDNFLELQIIISNHSNSRVGWMEYNAQGIL